MTKLHCVTALVAASLFVMSGVFAQYPVCIETSSSARRNVERFLVLTKPQGGQIGNTCLNGGEGELSRYPLPKKTFSFADFAPKAVSAMSLDTNETEEEEAADNATTVKQAEKKEESTVPTTEDGWYWTAQSANSKGAFAFPQAELSQFKNKHGNISMSFVVRANKEKSVALHVISSGFAEVINLVTNEKITFLGNQIKMITFVPGWNPLIITLKDAAEVRPNPAHNNETFISFSVGGKGLHNIAYVPPTPVIPQPKQDSPVAAFPCSEDLITASAITWVVTAHISLSSALTLVKDTPVIKDQTAKLFDIKAPGVEILNFASKTDVTVQFVHSNPSVLYKKVLDRVQSVNAIATACFSWKAGGPIIPVKAVKGSIKVKTHKKSLWKRFKECSLVRYFTPALLAVVVSNYFPPAAALIAAY